MAIQSSYRFREQGAMCTDETEDIVSQCFSSLGVAIPMQWLWTPRTTVPVTLRRITYGLSLIEAANSSSSFREITKQRSCLLLQTFIP